MYILFETYENSSIHRLENLMILFTKQYVFQTKMRSSRPSTMVLINVFTKRFVFDAVCLNLAYHPLAKISINIHLFHCQVYLSILLLIECMI